VPGKDGNLPAPSKRGQKCKGPDLTSPGRGLLLWMTDWDNAAYSNCPECQWSVSTSKVVPPGLAFHPEQHFNRQGPLKSGPFRFQHSRRILAPGTRKLPVHPWANTYFSLNDFTLGRLWETRHH
jgi:hypothetical protein